MTYIASRWAGECFPDADSAIQVRVLRYDDPPTEAPRVFIRKEGRRVYRGGIMKPTDDTSKLWRPDAVLPERLKDWSLVSTQVYRSTDNGVYVKIRHRCGTERWLQRSAWLGGGRELGKDCVRCMKISTFNDLSIEKTRTTCASCRAPIPRDRVNYCSQACANSVAK